MKKKITILLLALCLVLLAACGEPSPSDALKADIEKAKSSKLGEEKVDGETATVDLTITTYPLGEIFTNVLSELFSSNLEELGAMTEEELTAYMDETLISNLDKAEKNFETDLTVTLKKQDGKWVVEESEEFTNALTGGMLDFASSMMG